MFRPSDEAVFTTLGVNTHLFACEPAELESLVRTVGGGSGVPMETLINSKHKGSVFITGIREFLLMIVVS